MCSHGNNNGWVYFELGLTMYVRMYHTHVYTYDTYIYEQYLCLCLYISVSEYISVVVSVSIPTSTCLHARAGAFSLSLSHTHTKTQSHRHLHVKGKDLVLCFPQRLQHPPTLRQARHFQRREFTVVSQRRISPDSKQKVYHGTAPEVCGNVQRCVACVVRTSVKTDLLTRAYI